MQDEVTAGSAGHREVGRSGATPLCSSSWGVRHPQPCGVCSEPPQGRILMSATPASASSTSGRVSTARCPVKVPREKEWVRVRAPRYGAAPDMGESMQSWQNRRVRSPAALRPPPGLCRPSRDHALAPLVTSVRPLHPRPSGLPAARRAPTSRLRLAAPFSGHFKVTAQGVPGACCVSPAG